MVSVSRKVTEVATSKLLRTHHLMALYVVMCPQSIWTTSNSNLLLLLRTEQVHTDWQPYQRHNDIKSIFGGHNKRQYVHLLTITRNNIQVTNTVAALKLSDAHSPFKGKSRIATAGDEGNAVNSWCVTGISNQAVHGRCFTTKKQRRKVKLTSFKINTYSCSFLFYTY